MGSILTGLAAAAVLASPAASSPLSHFIGSARVLIVSAPVSSDKEFIAQNHKLAGFSAEMDDRDLVVVRVVGGEAHDTRGETLDAASIRRGARLAADRFGLVLIGKDGGLKLRATAPIGIDALFQVIDAMPMRREELGRAGK